MAVKTWSTPVTAEETRLIPCTLCGGNDFVFHFSCSASLDKKSAAGFTYVRCKHCGLIQINPQPNPAAVTLRYGGTETSLAGHGGDYLAYEEANEAAFLKLQELGLRDAGFFNLEQRLFSKVHNPAVLDIGCATGALLAKLRDRGWAVQGVEISGPQAACCRRRGLEVSSLPLEANHFAPQQFDLILASHLIEHLNDPGSFVREIYRICKPGGSFLVTTPNIGGFQAKLFGADWRSAIFDHLYLFSIKTLRKLLENAGFTVERVKTWGGLAAGIGPAPLKRIADAAVKCLNAGDVMIMRAVRPGTSG
ncbi:hypothetical protein AGMMS50230_13480 [Spirochaetia bacterium]|nr:hypothetical protein AGMMS50230_13480 [Spirochaetia bacterium]